MDPLQHIKKSVYFISFPLGFIAFILPVYIFEIGASVLEIGFLYSIFSLLSILMRPIVGKWVDVKGRKSGAIIGLGFYTLGMLIFLLGNTFNSILVAKVFQGIAASFFWISVDAIVADISNSKNRSENFGSIDQVSNRGAMIGSLIGFTILFNNNAEEPFKVIFLVYLITCLIGLYHGVTKGKETLPSNTNTPVGQSPNNTMSLNFKYFLAIMLILSLVGSMLSPIYLIFMRQHITEDLILITYLFIPGSILALYLPKKFGKLADTLGRKKVLIMGMLLRASTILFLPLLKGYFSFLIAYTILSIGGMLIYPAKMSLVTELTGGNSRGTNYGYYSLATGIGGVIGPLLGAFIYQFVGFTAFFNLYGLTILVSLGLICLVLSNQQQIQNSYTS